MADAHRNSARANVCRDAYDDARRAVEELVRAPGVSLPQVAAIVTNGAEQRMVRHLAMVPLGTPVCQPGCVYCCHVPRVLVTVPELAAIADAIGQRPPAEVEALLARIEPYTAQTVDPDAAESFVLGTLLPCPLLVDDRCLVYEARPLVCRAEHAYDAAQCEAQFRTGAGNTLQCVLVLDATDGTLSGVADGLRSAGLRGELMDLSRALRIVLDHPPGAIDEWLAAGRWLESAVVSDT